MEKALSSSNTRLPSYLYVNRKINLPSQSWALNVNYANSIDFLFVLKVINDSYQILCLSWLTYNNNSFVLCDIMLIKFCRVSNIEFFEAF